MTDLTSVFLSTRKRLMGVVGKIVPASEVEDIVQDTFVRAHLVKNKQDIQKPEAFMVQVAKNLAFDYVKSARVQKAYDPGDDFFDFLDSLHPEAHVDSAYKILASEQEFERFCEEAKKLPGKCREVYLLRKVYGFSQKEIAARLGLSESTVEKHIANGTKKLFLLMKNDMPSLKRKPKTTGSAGASS